MGSEAAVTASSHRTVAGASTRRRRSSTFCAYTPPTVAGNALCPAKFREQPRARLTILMRGLASVKTMEFMRRLQTAHFAAGKVKLLGGAVVKPTA